jgi:sortase A
MREKNKSTRRTLVVKSVGALLVLAAIVSFAWPFAAVVVNEIRLHSQSAATSEKVAGWSNQRRQKALEAAQAYNAELAQKQSDSQLGEFQDPFFTQSTQKGSSEKASDRYEKLLDTGDGVMGAIEIPKISVSLPIRHGTSAQTLNESAGHLYGSSLPVGGESTNSVIAAHRGLSDRMMFRRADELVVGDYLYVEVLGEKLTYRVSGIHVNQPQEKSHLGIQKGKDLLTLYTCTPYGINSKRLVITAERSRSAGTAVLDRWVVIGFSVVVVALGLLIFLVVRGVKRKSK